MAPLEVDVFRVPHHRMKSLVHRSLRNYAETDFSDSLAPEALLGELDSLLDEIRKHEAIEDSFIMKKLFQRVEELPGPRPDCWPKLKSEHTCVLPKISQLVARIGEALANLRDGEVDAKTVVGATYYVVLSLYLEHIVEEEGTVMALLVEYFDSSELVALRRLVLDEHARAMMDFSYDSGVESDGGGSDSEEEEIDVDMRSAGGLPFRSCEEAWACLEASVGDIRPDCLRPDLAGAVVHNQKTDSPLPLKLDDLPELALRRVFELLDRRDLVSCALVSPRLAAAAARPALWRRLDAADFGCDSDSDSDSDPAALSALFRLVLPRAGPWVEALVFRGCSGLHSAVFADLLAAAPNVEEVDFSFSPAVADECFQRLPPGSLRRLRRLDLTGCRGVTGHGLRLLARHWRAQPRRARGPPKKDRHGTGAGLEWLSLSGCCRVGTLDELATADFACRRLAHLDLSGCSLLDGATIGRFVARCPLLAPEDLYYCDGIEDGPYPDEANGCANLEDGRKACCMNREAAVDF